MCGSVVTGTMPAGAGRWGQAGRRQREPTVTTGRRSTFLTGRDLAGLKVCSVSSSPSIVSVQSDRGASCNSKLSQQSPRPSLKYRAHRMAPLRACSRDGGGARKVVGVALPRASPVPRTRATPDQSEEAVTVTYPAVTCAVSEATTDTITFRGPGTVPLQKRGSPWPQTGTRQRPAAGSNMGISPPSPGAQHFTRCAALRPGGWVPGHRAARTGVHCTERWRGHARACSCLAYDSGKSACDCSS